MYISRKGKTYYLHESITKTGKPRFTFSTKKENSINDIPNGYEIYEPPNGNVFLRKVFKRILLNAEIEIIEIELKSISKKIDYIIDEKKDGVGIYINEQNNQDLRDLSKIIFSINNLKYYKPAFRITKNDSEYNIERYCFLGGIEDWIFLERDSNLKRMCKKYFSHIGKESFFELM